MIDVPLLGVRRHTAGRTRFQAEAQVPPPACAAASRLAIIFIAPGSLAVVVAHLRRSNSGSLPAWPLSAHHHGLLMYIQPGAAFVHHSHADSPFRPSSRRTPESRESPWRAHSRLRVATIRCAHRRPGHTRLRACLAPLSRPTFIRRRLPPLTLPRVETVFIILCAPQAHAYSSN